MYLAQLVADTFSSAKIGGDVLIQKKESEFSRPKVVILPGPHKAGSSSLQQCMVDWTSNNHSRALFKEQNEQRQHPLPGWSWAVPAEETLVRERVSHPKARKAFASLAGIVDFDPVLAFDREELRRGRRVVSEERIEHVLGVFRRPMAEAWQENYNIIFGSEEMDRLVDPVHSNSSFIMKSWLSILPWNVSGTSRRLKLEEIEVVVVYRTPRLKHLISLWHEVGRRRETLRKYILRRLSTHVRYVDSLGLAQQFLSQNIRTTIIDLTGAKTKYGNKTNICHVVACDVLQTEECTKDTHRLAYLSSNPDLDNSDAIQNQKSSKASMNLTENETALIENVMAEYDCGFQTSFEKFQNHSLLRYLNANDMFANCLALGNGTEVPQRSLQWMVAQIRAAVRN